MIFLQSIAVDNLYNEVNMLDVLRELKARGRRY